MNDKDRKLSIVFTIITVLIVVYAISCIFVYRWMEPSRGEGMMLSLVMALAPAAAILVATFPRD